MILETERSFFGEKIIPKAARFLAVHDADSEMLQRSTNGAMKPIGLEARLLI